MVTLQPASLCSLHTDVPRKRRASRRSDTGGKRHASSERAKRSPGVEGAVSILVARWRLVDGNSGAVRTATARRDSLDVASSSSWWPASGSGRQEGSRHCRVPKVPPAAGPAGADQADRLCTACVRSTMLQPGLRPGAGGNRPESSRGRIPLGPERRLFRPTQPTTRDDAQDTTLLVCLAWCCVLGRRSATCWWPKAACRS